LTSSSLGRFERIARRAHRVHEASSERKEPLHPFEQRNIAGAFPTIVTRLFDDGHYAQATFEAAKFVDKEVQRHSKLSTSGFKLMMAALAAENPVLKLTPCKTESETDEQKGFQFIFAGTSMAIRNPRGHEHSVPDDVDTCLDHLGLLSLLLRRLAEAGFK
jgi:uncharacterized protein (TIGR02391 family)